MRFGNIVSVMTAGAASLLLALPAAAQTTGTLSGQVVDANSQQPVGDAVVIATARLRTIHQIDALSRVAVVDPGVPNLEDTFPRKGGSTLRLAIP